MTIKASPLLLAVFSFNGLSLSSASLSTSPAGVSIAGEDTALESKVRMFRTVPKVECPWLSSTSSNNVLECGDGSQCNFVSDGWDCCEAHAGRSKCPPNFPNMCNVKVCGGDHCCYTSCKENLRGNRLCHEGLRTGAASILMSPLLPRNTVSVHVDEDTFLDSAKQPIDLAHLSPSAACDTPFDPESDPLDLVLTWVNFTDRIPYMYPKDGKGRPNFSEMMYTFRSIVKHGLMPRLRKIFIVMNTERHAPPTWLLLENPKVRIVPHTEIIHDSDYQKEAASKPEGMRPRGNALSNQLHHIKGLSRWFIYLEDDTLLMNQFRTQGVFWDAKQKKILLHKLSAQGENAALIQYASNLLDQKFPKRHRGGEATHGPMFFDRCLPEEMERTWPAEYRCAGKDLYHCNLKPDALAFYENYALDSGSGVEGSHDEWSNEIHTNGMSDSSADSLRGTLASLSHQSPQWLDAQGDGFSEDYPRKSKLRAVVDEWYEHNFPNCSEFEFACPLSQLPTTTEVASGLKEPVFDGVLPEPQVSRLTTPSPNEIPINKGKLVQDDDQELQESAVKDSSATSVWQLLIAAPFLGLIVNTVRGYLGQQKKIRSF